MHVRWLGRKSCGYTMGETDIPTRGRRKKFGPLTKIKTYECRRGEREVRSKIRNYDERVGSGKDQCLKISRHAQVFSAHLPRSGCLGSERRTREES